MTKFKKTNKLSMDDIFVVKGDRVVPTGAFIPANTTVNLQDGQLGVLAWDFDSTTTALGDFKLATDDSNEVQAIKLVVGTPKSQSTHTVSLFEDGDLAFQQSGVIHKSNIRSVAVKGAAYPTCGAQLFEFAFTPEDNTEYLAYLRLTSVRNDKYYGDNDEVIHALVPAVADASTINDSYVIDYLAYELNLNSKAFSVTNSLGNKSGNRNFVVFAVQQGGGSGLGIGNIVPGTVIPFVTVNGTQSTIVATEEMVQAFAKFIDNSDSSLATTSTIELIDPSNFGVNLPDTLIVMGLPHTRAVAYDDIEQVMVQPELQLASGFRTADTIGGVFKATDVYAKEGTGQGWKWLIEWRHRMGLTVHTAQIQPRGDYFIEGKNYINPDYFYTSYIIEYYDTEETLTNTEVSPKKVVLLFRAEPDAAEAKTVSNVSTNDSLIVFVTSDDSGTGTASSLTVTYVNNILDAWLEHARANGNPFRVLGDASPGGAYLS